MDKQIIGMQRKKIQRLNGKLVGCRLLIRAAIKQLRRIEKSLENIKEEEQ